MNKKVDRRVKYTKMVLRHSFVELLREKPISRITVKEICERAEINRGTFYSHYLDQYDLLKKIEAELFDDISAFVDDAVTAGSINNLAEVLPPVLTYLKNNGELVTVLLSGNGDMNFQSEIITVMLNKCMSFFPTNGSDPELTLNTCFFMITGCFGIIRKWILEQPDKTPEEVSAAITGAMHNIPRVLC